jgi:outer membrane biosynthesis protein TonB
MSQSPTLYFEVYIDGQHVRTDALAQDVVKIGSHAKSHVCLDHPSVSRVHAYVEVSGAEVNIIDLGSGKGTYVNGEKVNKRALQHRDTITLGEVKLVYLTRDEKAEAAAAAAAAAARKKQKYVPPRDEVVYSRRFLARPAQNDGSVELAVLFNDHVLYEDIWRPPETIVIGATEKATLPIDHAALGADEFPLIEASGGEPLLSFTTAMTGEIYVGSERYGLQEAVDRGVARSAGKRHTVPLTADTRARLAFGDVMIFAHRSSEAALKLPFGFRSDSPVLFFALSVALHLAVLAMMFFWPSSLRDLRMDGFNPNDRFVQILIQDAQPEEPPPEPEEAEEEQDEPEENEGEQAAGDEGRAGEETAEPEEARMAIEGDASPDTPIELARAQAVQEVQDRGALMVLNQAGPASLFGDTAVGYDPITAIGGVSGDQLGASYGTRGLGRYGGGLGGGGRSMAGGFGAGPIAVRGRASGDTSLGQEQLAVRDREARVPTVSLGDSVVRGQLDRDIIQRVVREHRREIRACYEAELQRNPELAGRISVEWVISPDGAVAAAQIENSTMNNAEVEGCLTRRIRSWRFPEPRGGGTVRVTYPFEFTAGG